MIGKTLHTLLTVPVHKLHTLLMVPVHKLHTLLTVPVHKLHTSLLMVPVHKGSAVFDSGQEFVINAIMSNMLWSQI
jgi:hypothetical protein